MSDDLLRLRTTAVLGAREGMRALRVTGEQAFDLLDAVSPRPLFLRDGSALHTLFLDEDGHAWADVYICCDDLDYLLLVEGPEPDELIHWLGAHGAGMDAEVVDLSSTHAVIGLDGPYSWELLGEIVGPPIVGLPYLSLAQLPELDGLGLRAGKTGEYGYDLVVPRAAAASARERLLQRGQRCGLGPADQVSMDLASLENGFFCVRHPGVRRLGPVELQLQWRVDPRRTFPGADALRRARQEVRRRITWFLGDGEAPGAGQTVRLGGDPIGEVVHAAVSPICGAVGFALIDRDTAHPGLPIEIDGRPFRTATVPVIHNRSLFIDAQRHALASRELDVFPPLVPA